MMMMMKPLENGEPRNISQPIKINKNGDPGLPGDSEKITQKMGGTFVWSICFRSPIFISSCASFVSLKKYIFETGEVNVDWNFPPYVRDVLLVLRKWIISPPYK